MMDPDCHPVRVSRLCRWVMGPGGGLVRASFVERIHTHHGECRQKVITKGNIELYTLSHFQATQNHSDDDIFEGFTGFQPGVESILGLPSSQIVKLRSWLRPSGNSKSTDSL